LHAGQNYAKQVYNQT